MSNLNSISYSSQVGGEESALDFFNLEMDERVFLGESGFSAEANECKVADIGTMDRAEIFERGFMVGIS